MRRRKGISFCAYNTAWGGGHIEKMHMTATLTKWYEEHGRHEILRRQESEDGTMRLTHCGAENIVTTELQHDLDNLGIAKNRAREERARTRRQPRRS